MSGLSKITPPAGSRRGFQPGLRLNGWLLNGWRLNGGGLKGWRFGRMALAGLVWLAVVPGSAPSLAAETGLAPALLPALPPARLTPALNKLIRHGGVAVGFNGRTEWATPNDAFIPASILKLATTQTALKQLGADYRFKTGFYLGTDGTLYIKGYGDPFLVSEEWRLIARELEAAGVFRRPIKGVVVDDTAFAPDVEVDGRSLSSNPYDARLGAAVSNFNTVFVVVGRDGSVTSAEPQTPITPLAVVRGRAMGPGRDRVSFSKRPLDGPRYTGELAKAFFAEAGARFVPDGGVAIGRVPPELKAVWVHHNSRPLSELVRACLEFSNNFIANQLVLAMSLETTGEPARLEPGLALVRDHLQNDLHIPPDEFHLEEGAGLSRKNRVSLLAMLAIVDGFHSWNHLLSPFGKGPLQAPGKTGTLTGVYTLAGFLPAPAGQRRPFVVLLNQNRNTRQAVFDTLARYYSQALPTSAR